MEQSGRTAQQAASELNSCTDEWKRLLDNLSRETDSQGDKLIRTAANYRKGEQDATRSVGAVEAQAPSARAPRGVPTVPAGTGTGGPARATPRQEEMLRNTFDEPRLIGGPARAHSSLERPRAGGSDTPSIRTTCGSARTL
ncbi:hypothetical protein ACIHEI_09240 [Kitasatospora sp. NPDC051984]|uniref:hypothetical protein n=1 Tax=Kitasatospora sp. NPDC051984 TaxID=3364059 RepID=UPI0037C5A8A5